MPPSRRASTWGFDLDDLGAALQTLIDEPRLALERIRAKSPLRRRVGLALGGGAQRGIAHLGVLSVFEREGLVPDFVAGTSAGSAVGAMYCYGWSVSQMVQLVAGLNWAKLGRPQWNVMGRLGFLDGERMERYFRELLGDLTFEELPIPLAVIAADLLTGKEISISSGSVALGVRASCALPGAFTPVPYGEHLLVDGGIVNNLPTSAVAEQGANYIIAVDVSASTEPLEPPQNLLDVVQLAYICMRRRATRPDPPADCLIVPHIGETDVLNLSANLKRVYQAGADAAQSALPQLQRDLGL